jgi:hypothetical protein
MMTTETREGPVRVEGTPFEVVSVSVTWEHDQLQVAADHAGWASHDLGGSLMSEQLGDVAEDPPEDLPAWGEPTVCWTVRHTGIPLLMFPYLWRQVDAEYLAREVYAACPAAWAQGNLVACRKALSERVTQWLRLVPPLLNRGVPQQLLVGCRRYVEAAR